MRSVFSKGLLLALIALLCTGLMLGQATKTNGRLDGTVKDSSGGVIPGVTITLASNTGTRTAVTGDSGEFHFPFLTPGTYDVKADLQGFKTFEQKAVVVRLGQSTDMNIVLQPGDINELVVVKDAAPLVDPTSTTVGANISETLYASVPMNRNFTALTNMAPGVADSGAGSANPSIGGGSGLENNVVVDGVNITNPGYGGTGTYSANYGSLGTGVNFDFVKEVQVKSGGFEAEYGQSTGGVVNVITKSGTNDFHGGLYFYAQPSGFSAYRPQPDNYKQLKTGSTLNTESFDVSGDFSGFIVKDKLFFYLGFNPQWQSQYQMAPIDSPQWFNGMTEKAGYYEQKDTIYSWSGKLNWMLTGNHNFEFSTTSDPSRRNLGPIRNLTGDGDNSYSDLHNMGWSFINRYNGVLTNSWFLTASLGRSYNRFNENAVHPDYIAYNDWTRADKARRGGLGFLENNANYNWQFNAKTTYNFKAHGDHQFDFGYTHERITFDQYRGYTGPRVDIPAFDIGGDEPYHFAGAYVLGTSGRLRNVAWWPVPVYQMIRGNQNDPNCSTSTKYHSFYVQDAWKITNKITIKAGVRYDYQKMMGGGTNAIGFTFSGNWAPRLGVTYDLRGDGKTKIYGSWGRFYEKIPNDIAVRSFSAEQGYQNAWYEATLDAQGRIHLGRFINALAERPVVETGGLTTIDPDAKTMYQDEFVIGIDHQLRNDLSVGARFIWRDVRRVLEDIGSVTVAQSEAGANQNFEIANPSAMSDYFNNVTGDVGPDGKPDGFANPERSYTALELTLEKRFSQGFQFLANYRLSKLWGNYEGLFRNDNGQNDPNISSLFDFRWDGTRQDPLYWQFQPGYLNTDRRHVLNFNGAYVYKKFTIGMGARFSSGTPLTGLLAHPSYLNAGELPDGPRGNYGRTDWINNIDFHMDYPIAFGDKCKLRMGLDLFNVFNRKKTVAMDENIQLGSPGAGLPPENNPDFMTPNTFQEPFHARLSLRLEF